MPEGSASLQLAVGDRVVYPNQGVCRVSAIDVKEVAGQKLTFVTMRREEDGAVVMVPQAKVQSIGVRKVATPEDVERIFVFLRAETDKENLDWKQRARNNVERMTLGGILGLAEVVKGLQELSELRPL
ncbi:MAG TPA: CarD family transcriptional regulator, partial [Archangium sp.]